MKKKNIRKNYYSLEDKDLKISKVSGLGMTFVD